METVKRLVVAMVEGREGGIGGAERILRAVKPFCMTL